MKKYNLKVAGLALACGSLLMVSGGTIAATDTATITVNSTIATVCDFGGNVPANITYDYVTRNRTVDEDVIVNPTLACTTGTDTIELGIKAGSDIDGTYQATDGNSNFLNVSVYSDEDYTDVWGDESGVNRFDPLSPAVNPWQANGEYNAIPIYLRAAQHQNVPAGSYSVLLTLTAYY